MTKPGHLVHLAEGEHAPTPAATIWPPHLVGYIRRRLPPIEQVQVAIGDSPQATLPAIFIHLCLLRIEQLEWERQEASLRASPAVAAAIEQANGEQP